MLRTRIRAGRSGVWISARTRDFSLLRNVQTSSEAHPASCSTGTGVLSRGKVSDAWCWLLYLVPSLRISGATPPTSPICLPGVNRGNILLFARKYTVCKKCRYFDVEPGRTCHNHQALKVKWPHFMVCLLLFCFKFIFFVFKTFFDLKFIVILLWCCMW
jgi:hypothetical protein